MYSRCCQGLPEHAVVCLKLLTSAGMHHTDGAINKMHFRLFCNVRLWFSSLTAPFSTQKVTVGERASTLSCDAAVSRAQANLLWLSSSCCCAVRTSFEEAVELKKGLASGVVV